MIRIYLFFFAICVLACQQNKPEAEETAGLELPEDFIAFYERFHADSSFQMNHIIFPLPGKPASDDFDMEFVDFKWTRAGWKVHQAFDENDDTFDRRYKLFDEGLISEIIYSPTYGYYMERRFAKMTDGWNLIYYADIQEK